MQFGGYSNERPLWQMGSVPMDLTRTLVMAHIVTAVLVAMLIGGGGGGVLNGLTFSAEGLRSLRVWTLVSYPFTHMVSIGLAIDLVVLWWFGSEVESFLGRKGFAWLYVALAGIPAVVVFLLAPYLTDMTLAGASEMHFGIFIGFALIYPRARLIFNIEAKWFAIVLVAIGVISDLAYHQWMHLWFSVSILGVVFFVLHRRGAGGPQAILGWFGSRTQHTSARVEEARIIRRQQKEEATEQRIDAILDKVSEHGINSLTEKERRILRDAGRRGK